MINCTEPLHKLHTPSKRTTPWPSWRESAGSEAPLVKLGVCMRSYKTSSYLKSISCFQVRGFLGISSRRRSCNVNATSQFRNSYSETSITRRTPPESDFLDCTPLIERD